MLLDGHWPSRLNYLTIQSRPYFSANVTRCCFVFPPLTRQALYNNNTWSHQTGQANEGIVMPNLICEIHLLIPHFENIHKYVCITTLLMWWFRINNKKNKDGKQYEKRFFSLIIIVLKYFATNMENFLILFRQLMPVNVQLLSVVYFVAKLTLSSVKHAGCDAHSLKPVS